MSQMCVAMIYLKRAIIYRELLEFASSQEIEFVSELLIRRCMSMLELDPPTNSVEGN